MESPVASWPRQAHAKRTTGGVRPEALSRKESRCNASGVGVIILATVVALVLYIEWQWTPKHLRLGGDPEFLPFNPLRSLDLLPKPAKDARKRSDLPQVSSNHLPVPDPTSPEPPKIPHSSLSKSAVTEAADLPLPIPNPFSKAASEATATRSAWEKVGGVSTSHGNFWEQILHPKERWRQAILADLREAKQIITGEVPSERLPISDDEPQGPTYHDAEQFQRSYREMERRMKIYVYKYGDKPLVHSGPPYGIYVSEGKVIRSLRLKEKSPFVTKDPKKAHLFFLPFSVAQASKTLVHQSDGAERFARYHKRMREFFIAYMAEIARREPYFNISHATDHFYVSCHDWGAKTARLVPMLHQNAMKLLCNSDVRTGDYAPGRDAGYLEVNIKKFGRYPEKSGGAERRDRKILAFFAGQVVGNVRPALVDYWGSRGHPDIQVFTRMSFQQIEEMSYEARMKHSKFCLCPAGYDVNSPRIVESMVHECVPVIIADGFDLPFSDVLRWDTFSIQIAEKDIPQIRNILLNVSDSKWAKLQAQLKYVRRHFIFNSPPQKYDAYHMGLHSLWLRRIVQLNGEPPWNRTLKL